MPRETTTRRKSKACAQGGRRGSRQRGRTCKAPEEVQTRSIRDTERRATRAEGGEPAGASEKGRTSKDVPQSQDFYSKCNEEGLRRVSIRDVGLGVTSPTF